MGVETVLAVIILAVIVCLIFYVYSLPPEKKKKRHVMKRTDAPVVVQDNRTIERLENRVKSLKHKVLHLENVIKEKDKQIAVENFKARKIQDKLEQERDWQEREGRKTEKRAEGYKALKEELKRWQDNFASEHTKNIHLEREMTEKNLKLDDMNDQRRKIEAEAAQLKVKVEQTRRELNLLKKDYNNLRKEQDDTQWIAKTEYDKVLNELKQKEKDLERTLRERQ